MVQAPLGGVRRGRHRHGHPTFNWLHNAHQVRHHLQAAAGHLPQQLQEPARHCLWRQGPRLLRRREGDE